MHKSMLKQLLWILNTEEENTKWNWQDTKPFWMLLFLCANDERIYWEIPHFLIQQKNRGGCYADDKEYDYVEIF